MARIKHTKNEMKAQREALARFERFLPMLQLKKQQLQIEIQTTTAKITAKQAEEGKIRSGLKQWSDLFSEPAGIENVISLESVKVEKGNIAGVSIPIFLAAIIRTEEYDLFSTPPWMDEGMEIIAALIRLRSEREILEEQRRLVLEELRITSQRVNLFEKVKIPEARENIRVIRIFLGDEQTAGVARAKIAKSRTVMGNG